MQKEIIAGWMDDFDKILSSNCKNKSNIWIYRWTRCATTCQPAQCVWVGRFELNRTRIDGSDAFATRTTDFGTVWFWPWPSPNTTVWNHCQHYFTPELSHCGADSGNTISNCINNWRRFVHFWALIITLAMSSIVIQGTMNAPLTGELDMIEIMKAYRNLLSCTVTDLTANIIITQLAIQLYWQTYETHQVEEHMSEDSNG